MNLHGMQEVSGSIPLSSTSENPAAQIEQQGFFVGSGFPAPEMRPIGMPMIFCPWPELDCRCLAVRGIDVGIMTDRIAEKRRRRWGMWRRLWRESQTRPRIWFAAAVSACAAGLICWANLPAQTPAASAILWAVCTACVGMIPTPLMSFVLHVCWSIHNGWRELKSDLPTAVQLLTGDVDIPD